MVEIHKEECMLLLQLPKCQLLAHTYTKDKKMYLLPVLGIFFFLIIIAVVVVVVIVVIVVSNKDNNFILV